METGNANASARSPWSAHHDKRLVRVHPPQSKLDGVIRLAGSKSMTNRALLMAAMAAGTSRIEGILKSDDSYWCVDALTKLGIRVDIEGETAHLEGCGGDWPAADGELYVGAAGTVARFLPALLAAGRSGGNWTLTGSRRMSERPMAALLDALEQLGARFEYAQRAKCLPLRLEANGLRGGTAAIAGSTSSQFISGLLLAAPYAEGGLTVRIEGEVVQRDYVQMTLDMMELFGVKADVSDDGQSISVWADGYKANSITLEPDISACCYFWAAAALTGGRIRIEGIRCADTRQPDIEMLDVLERMGCTVLRGDSFAEVAGTGRLHGGFTLSMKRWSDQTLTIAAMAVFADGPITLT
ncbi:MAG: 3-phosphoshikimate 1-carboxyvinyltransferase, partial [Paenibacillus sp.]|nr:3-phosphoshikimate 1-carboxyvinyltransferase [Paenibacillus sp.]